MPLDPILLHELLDRLCQQRAESELVEFKVNNSDPDRIGKNCAALSNSARLHDYDAGYLVFGVEDGTHRQVGTLETIDKLRVGNESLMNWLSNMLNPKASIEAHTFKKDGKSFTILKVPPAVNQPTEFKNIPYIRIGSTTRKLSEFPESMRQLWEKCSVTTFEQGIAGLDYSSDELLDALDVPKFSELLGYQYPAGRDEILDRLLFEGAILKQESGQFSITNLGGLLFARDLEQFPTLRRKAIRVVQYAGTDRLEAKSESIEKRGYAVGIESLIDYVNGLLPGKEVIEGAIRETDSIYPIVALREVIVNALIHQDLYVRGSGPLIEIFEDRIEVTNPGAPLFDVLRLMDHPPMSRNEQLASLMRRAGFCEERGSGVDRVVALIEFSQLPGPEFEAMEHHMRVVVRGPREFADLTAEQRVTACYWHSCLKYLSGEHMTNASLRARLGVSDGNYPMVSRVLADAKERGLIRPFDPQSTSKKLAKYVPAWARSSTDSM